ncbi:MAG TPA: NrdH-redoxin [Rheinheimera sp.]|uniref:glutaredoxin family protein n=1 Tax=unclassified Rheinheimera TaxID=115860 RepID=UPI000ECD14D7|nr:MULTISPECIES: glutaredoxin family protein [unclassified Rheinheimera]MCT6699314.1 glutaredoxin family protein [Rheinheimera sp. 4Y26]HCU66242.1 NrdH-redoxin [Rheinheimera sp.]
MQAVTLYSTWGCHLCEEAEALLKQAAVNFQLVDIVDDEQAFATFRLHIPVVAIEQQYLYWPFDLDALTAFVKTHSNKG